MLAVVLLHVVEATLPVDPSFHVGSGGERAIEEVEDFSARLLHVDDLDPAQRSSIGRLAATLGVEGAAIEERRRLAVSLRAGDDARGEVRQIGIAQVEALGHRMLAPSGARILSGAFQFRAVAGAGAASLIPFFATHSSKSKFFGTPRVIRGTFVRSGLKTLRRGRLPSWRRIPAMSVRL